MGKGDKKSKKGKIWKGSYGNSRKRKVKASYSPSEKVEKVEKAEKVEVVAKPKAKKAPKKAAARKKAKPADKE